MFLGFDKYTAKFEGKEVGALPIICSLDEVLERRDLSIILLNTSNHNIQEQ